MAGWVRSGRFEPGTRKELAVRGLHRELSAPGGLSSTAFAVRLGLCFFGPYLYAIAALAGPARWITSHLRNPASLHHREKSAPVKSKASPNSISMLSDIISP